MVREAASYCLLKTRFDEGEVQGKTVSQNECIYFWIPFHHVNWPHSLPFVQQLALVYCGTVSDLLQSVWIRFRIIFFQSIKSYIDFLFGMIFLEPDLTEEMVSWILLTVLEYLDLHMRRELKILLVVNTVIITCPNISCHSY